MSRQERRAAVCAVLVAAALAGCKSQPAPELAPSPETVTTRDPSSISAEDIERAPAGETIQKILEGKVSGVTVSQAPDGSVAVRIRGVSSFYAGNEPLYVLDGIPYSPGPSGSLKGINPHDIESIKVLKDPAETGIYGTRGANGVILITTKKPGRSTGG